MRKRLFAMILMAVVAVPLNAQRGSRVSSTSDIKVVASGVQCTSNTSEGFDVAAWNWGGSTQIDLAPGGQVGKSALGGVLLQRYFDACSPYLFQYSAQGKHFDLLTLTQTNTGDNSVVTEVKLKDVLLESYQLSSSAGQNVPSESVSLRFRKIQITPAGGGTKVCYDVTTSAPCSAF